VFVAKFFQVRPVTLIGSMLPNLFQENSMLQEVSTKLVIG